MVRMQIVYRGPYNAMSALQKNFTNLTNISKPREVIYDAYANRIYTIYGIYMAYIAYGGPYNIGPTCCLK